VAEAVHCADGDGLIEVNDEVGPALAERHPPPANLLLAFRPHHVLGLASADIPFRDFRVF
jgi:hypothetical protein